MTLAERLVFGTVVAAGLTFIATPYAIRLADRLQFYDEPTGGYKPHTTRTPYLGGAAVMVGFVVAVLVVAGHWGKTGALLGPALALWVVGTLDDRRTVSASLRLLLELGFAVLVWATGLGWHLHAGAAVDLTVTCLWIVSVVNAFNLYDHMDGAAGTMALVVSAAAGTIGVVRGNTWLAISAACLCGACLGFLPRNVAKPARIFLGDGGSMPIGFAVAVLVGVAAGTSTVAWQSLPVALLLIGVLALDTTLRVVSRRRRGVSLLTGGRDGLAHRTLGFLPGARAVALSLGVAQAALSVIATLASRGDSALLVISASLYVLVAGGVIIVLDAQTIEESEGASGGRLSLSKRAVAALIVLGLGSGVSPFFFTFYDASKWAPIGLAIAVVCAIGLVMRPRRPSAPATLSLLGLLGLGVLSLSSTAWAESVENAVVSGNRWLAYGALLLLLLALVSHDRRSAVLLGAVTIGITAVALSVLVRLLGDDPGSLFLHGRLNSPLGYINGEGCLFAMGIWPWVAVAETRRGAQAGAALALATLMACLALLSQSRGTALALALALLAVFGLVPLRARRGYAMLALAAGVTLAAPPLLHVYEHRVAGAVRAADAHAAARAALLAALAVGAVWALATHAWAHMGTRSHENGARLRTIGTRVLLVPVAVAVILALASTHRIETEAQKQYHAFIHLSEPGENLPASASASANRSRLLSGAGNRYDYWRIAWHVFEGDPLIGIGAGNYPRPYFAQRATTEDVQQPHSIEMQALSELGLAGALLLCAFIGGVAWGAVRARRGAARSPLRRALTVAALGMFTVWLAQTSVDWMHLLPGLTAIALAAAVALVWPRAAPAAARAAQAVGNAHAAGAADAAPRWARARGGGAVAALGGRSAAALGISGIVVTLILAGASLSRQSLAEEYRSRAQGELASDPAKALSDANRSLDVDSDSLQSYFVKAAALAHFDQASAAEAALERALAREPRNFLTWALLGDVSARQLRFALAAREYAHAHALNPRNATLTLLAREPRAALR